MPPDMYADVMSFHQRFVPDTIEILPKFLDGEKFDFRKRFLLEEVEEFVEAHREHDLAGAADALVDLVYVAIGTAIMMGLPWEKMWDEVQAANMRKVRGDPDASNSKRQSRFDVVKPEGWQPPDIQGVLKVACQALKDRT